MASERSWASAYFEGAANEKTSSPLYKFHNDFRAVLEATLHVLLRTSPKEVEIRIWGIDNGYVPFNVFFNKSVVDADLVSLFTPVYEKLKSELERTQILGFRPGSFIMPTKFYNPFYGKLCKEIQLEDKTAPKQEEEKAQKTQDQSQEQLQEKRAKPQQNQEQPREQADQNQSKPAYRSAPF
jgi:hypothetical protein